MVIFHGYVSLPEGTGYVIAIVSLALEQTSPMLIPWQPTNQAKDSGHTAVLGRLIQATAGFTKGCRKLLVMFVLLSQTCGKIMENRYKINHNIS